MPKGDRSIELLSEIIKTCNVIGFQKTLEVNICARQNSQKLADIEVDRVNRENTIVTEVCKVFNITYSDLMKKCTRGSRKDAQTVAYVYFRLEQKYSLKDIQKIFNCDTGQASRYITYFNKLSPNDKYDKVLIDKYNNLVENLKDKFN